MINQIQSRPDFKSKQSPYNQALNPVIVPRKHVKNSKTPHGEKLKKDLQHPFKPYLQQIAINKAQTKTNRKSTVNVEQKIDDINIKLQGLDQHLVLYDSGMQQILNEIPKDVKSLKSSSRYNFQMETERNSNFVRKSNMNTNNIFNESTNLQRDDSEQTLKTIMDFKSERAHTGQRLHREKMISNGQFPQQMRVSF